MSVSGVQREATASRERGVYVRPRRCPHCGEEMFVAAVQGPRGFLGGPQTAVESHVAQMAGVVIARESTADGVRYASRCPHCSRAVNRRVERHAWIESITEGASPIVVVAERSGEKEGSDG